jgi:hypothetical protein
VFWDDFFPSTSSSAKNETKFQQIIVLEKEDIWTEEGAKKTQKKNIQQQVFAGGHPPNY